MKSVNEFGLFCRKLRLDNHQILKEMADILGVSPSYLSAVENGKRNIPRDWYDKISSFYNLTSSEKNKLLEIIKGYDLQFNDMFSQDDLSTKQMLITFARRCKENSLTPEKIEKIFKIMDGEEDESTSKK